MSGSTTITPTSATPPKLTPDVIITNTCCGNFIYNVPRAAVMITLPGVIILVIGAILLSCTDRSNGWFNDDALICTIFLILGGAWTLGAVLFWAVNWCQNRPKGPSPRSRKRAASDGGGYDVKRTNSAQVGVCA